MVSIDSTHRGTTRKGRGLSVKKCLYAVLCFSCCILLLPILASLVLDADSIHAYVKEPPQWRPMEPASLPQLRHTASNSNGNQQQKRYAEESQPPDGTFNGFPVHLRVIDDNEQQQPTHYSRVHCVGDNYQPDDDWLQRSCHFSMLCYDLAERDFVIFQSYREQVLNRFLQARPAMSVSSIMHRKFNETTAVALGGINKKWNYDIKTPVSSKGFKWFPRVLNATNSMQYYALPANTVLVPYHSLAAKNPGHLVWDDFLPIYTLLTMFQLQNRVLIPLRVHFNHIKLWSSCEMSDHNEHLCQKMTLKFASLLVGKDYPYNWTTTDTVHFVPSSSQQSQSSPQSNYVCAPRGAAGLGPLTDHGTKKLHGWIRDDYKITHNHGRGALLYEFRNFMLQNLGLPLQPVTSQQQPFKVVFSVSSSDIGSRDLDFVKQINTLRENFDPTILSVESYVMKDLTVPQQVQIASEAAFFITICGGGAVTAMFLPKGATVILYYLEHGGVEYGRPTHSYAFLDWDLFNNLSHLRTHWLPTQTMDNRIDLRALVLLMEQELELMQNENMMI
ncbi:expressed unknown protein [Seminavis robusta]|uniref:Uncharacterized protein n=1 Tax=Seminavis robusta TaxID=568900 RepID=A0A9N8EEZ8_9STRA|nr:expressed unknown protein [Seminavis robusta]|eukprot:Sro1026_g232890.1 n/a (559) ;mRNA; f:17662-19338